MVAGLPDFFYVDEAHTQQGPVSASHFCDLYRAKLVSDRTCKTSRIQTHAATSLQSRALRMQSMPR